MLKQQKTIKELKRLSDKELKRTLIEKKEKLRLLGFDLPGGKVKNVREIQETRKHIARVSTIISTKKA